jgi:hypothetical protein
VEGWEVAARVAIGDLVARYNALGDAGRIAEMLALFTEDAVLSLDGNEHRGRGEIAGLFEEAIASTRGRIGGRVQHFTATHQIDFAGPGNATGRCYFQVLTEAGLDHWGRYVDEYLAVAGVWRLAKRRVDVLGCVPGGWADARRRVAATP